VKRESPAEILSVAKDLSELFLSLRSTPLGLVPHQRALLRLLQRARARGRPRPQLSVLPIDNNHRITKEIKTCRPERRPKEHRD
jgi:hypothetical protein